MFIILIVLLTTMFISLLDFRQNWLLSYRWIEKEFGHDILGKITAGFCATFAAPVITIFSSIKNQLVNTQQTSEQTTQERFNGFVENFVGIFNTDWNNDTELNQLVYSFGWIAPNLFGISFHKLPSDKEFSDLKRRCQYYGAFEGWRFSDFGTPVLWNFNDGNRWCVPIILVDQVQENENARIAELARVERERELDILSISLINQNRENIRGKTNGNFPLWADRKGNYQLIKLNSHMLLTGSTGAGKTGTLTYWLWLIDNLKNNQDELFILDYKRGKDWYAFYTSKNYASAEDTKGVWDKLYHQFKLYQTGVEDIGDKVVYIIIDELSSLVESYTTKKERDEFLRQFKDMLRLSRSLGTGRGGYRLIVGLQQADSTYFGGTEGRGNIGIRVALGGITTEGARMIFEITDESDKPESSPVGKGFAQIYGQPVQRIMIPFIEDKELVLKAIARRYTS
mgnify:CR=1 FL=1